MTNTIFSPNRDITQKDIDEIVVSVDYYAHREKALVGDFSSLVMQMVYEVAPNDLPSDPEQARRLYKLAVVKEVLRHLGIEPVGK